ncbi:MAG: DUF4037 domain-containing protein [Candidatus Micrarchaeota archaeon]|nr:DUF4037 domain-containing protein [Candidatus Micrarchaeota archaeon]
MAKFIPGLRLSERFYNELVKPIIKKEFPLLKYSACLIGPGSEVLGFDTPLSTDHHWGPRLLIFLLPKDIKKKKQISAALSKKLPPMFLGYSTNFGKPDKIGVRLLEKAKKGSPISHMVKIHAIQPFFKSYLGFNPNGGIKTADWLVLSEQKLRTIRDGKVFYDQLGLKKIQKRLNYYPKDVWLYQLASEWMKVSQEEPFVGRCGEVGDDIGSRIIAARLAHSAMKLSFLMEKQYAPYSKWFGTAFSKLKCSRMITPFLTKAASASNWKEREKNLSKAYECLAKMHNSLKLTKPIQDKATRFFSRQYLVIHGDAFAKELKGKIRDKTLKKMTACIGSANQLSDNSDFLDNNRLLKKMKSLYY